MSDPRRATSAFGRRDYPSQRWDERDPRSRQRRNGTGGGEAYRSGAVPDKDREPSPIEESRKKDDLIGSRAGSRPAIQRSHSVTEMSEHHRTSISDPVPSSSGALRSDAALNALLAFSAAGFTVGKLKEEQVQARIRLAKCVRQFEADKKYEGQFPAMLAEDVKLKSAAELQVTEIGKALELAEAQLLASAVEVSKIQGPIEDFVKLQRKLQIQEEKTGTLSDSNAAIHSVVMARSHTLEEHTRLLNSMKDEAKWNKTTEQPDFEARMKDLEDILKTQRKSEPLQSELTPHDLDRLLARSDAFKTLQVKVAAIEASHASELKRVGTLQAKVEALQAEKETLNSKVKQIDALQASHETFASKLQQVIQTSVDALKDKEAIESNTQQLKAQVQADIDSQSASISLLSTKIDTFTAEFRENFGLVSRRFTDIGADLLRLKDDQKNNGWEEKHKTLEASTTAFAACINAQSEDRNRLSEIEAKLSAQEQSAKNTSKAQISLRDDALKLNQKISHQENQLQALKHGIQGLQSQYNNLTTEPVVQAMTHVMLQIFPQAKNVEEEISTIKKKLDTLGSQDNNRMAQDLNALQVQIARLESADLKPATTATSLQPLKDAIKELERVNDKNVEKDEQRIKIMQDTKTNLEAQMDAIKKYVEDTVDDLTEKLEVHKASQTLAIAAVDTKLKELERATTRRTPSAPNQSSALTDSTKAISNGTQQKLVKVAHTEPESRTGSYSPAASTPGRSIDIGNRTLLTSKKRKDRSVSDDDDGDEPIRTPIRRRR